jgi:cytochrome d ubiquinol oxidase subunit II
MVDRAIFWAARSPILFGVAFANLVRGVPIGSVTVGGSFLDLLNPYALLGGVTTLLLFTLHGGVFLALKTDGDLRVRARTAARWLAVPAAASVFGFLTWTFFNARDNDGVVPGVVPIAAIVAVVAVEWLLRERLEGWAFVATGLAIAALTATIFLNPHPRVMPSSLERVRPDDSNASSTHHPGGDDGRGCYFTPIAATRCGRTVFRDA